MDLSVELPPESLRAAPWVRLARVLRPDSSDLFLKLEHLSPTGSAYDRRCWALIKAAETDGRLQAGMRVLEGSDGATAVSMAWVCANSGHPFTAFIPENATLETRELLRAYGAEVEITPFTQGLRGAIARAAEKASELGAVRAWSPRLHHNAETVALQRELLGRELELAAKAQGRIDAFVCGVGTGATLAAVAELKPRLLPAETQQTSPIQLVAVEPTESATLSGGAPHPHRLLGLGPGFIPASVTAQTRSAIDWIATVSAEAAWRMKERIAREEGLLVGIATGAGVVAAVDLAAQLGPERAIFTLASDTGERYFSLAEQFP